MARTQTSVVLNPAELELYASVDPQLPALITQVRDRQLEREYNYAMMGLRIAGLGLFLVIGGFMYLVMNGHPQSAAWLLGSGGLTAIAGFQRARYRLPEGAKDPAVETPENLD
jgi:hypothetical protein